jgi:hypothetical protein
MKNSFQTLILLGRMITTYQKPVSLERIHVYCVPAGKEHLDSYQRVMMKKMRCRRLPVPNRDLVHAA